MIELIIFLIILVILLIIFLFYFYRKSSKLEEQFQELSFLKSSQSVKYGKLTEQWIPLSEEFPFDSKNFKFLGQPIDGIQFNEDKIIFCEFKTNTASLNEKQRKIKSLIEGKKVEWFELNLKPKQSN